MRLYIIMFKKGPFLGFNISNRFINDKRFWWIVCAFNAYITFLSFATVLLFMSDVCTFCYFCFIFLFFFYFSISFRMECFNDVRLIFCIWTFFVFHFIRTTVSSNGNDLRVNGSNSTVKKIKYIETPIEKLCMYLGYGLRLILWRFFVCFFLLFLHSIK